MCVRTSPIIRTARRRPPRVRHQRASHTRPELSRRFYTSRGHAPASARRALPPSSKLMMAAATVITKASMALPPATQGGAFIGPPPAARPYLIFHTIIAGIIPNRIRRNVPEYSRAGRNAVGAQTATSSAGVSIPPMGSSRSRILLAGSATAAALTPTFGEDLCLGLKPLITSARKSTQPRPTPRKLVTMAKKLKMRMATSAETPAEARSAATIWSAEVSAAAALPTVPMMTPCHSV
mmetsp:Transcript_4148/g.10118  ORF Transcript_4148/g.10118 Transcript_4148/m.10118 type:complete len:237 (-) Transcript_4148:1203-1913(-)